MANAGRLVGAEFGHALRREREARARSLAWLSAETKVGLVHLQALEEGHFSELPGGVFRRGIVRAYLQAVGLEEQSWMPRFQQLLAQEPVSQSDESTAEAWEQFAENVRRNRHSTHPAHTLRWFGVAALLAVVLTAAWAVWHYEISPRLKAQSLRSTPPEIYPPAS